MRNLSHVFTVAVFIALCFFGVTISSAQAVGDFQSAVSGNWSNASTWLTYDGSTWSAATSTPSTGKAVHIVAPHVINVDVSVSVDSVIVDTLSSLVINSGVTMSVVPSATVINGGRISCADGSVTVNGTYQHARDAGSIPQKAVWNTYSTCLVTGTVATAPSNASQNFYNFAWLCRGQTGSLNIAWNNITIAGSVNILNTGAKGASLIFLRMTSNAFTPNNITINGNLNVAGDSVAFTASGSGAPNHTVNVNILGNLNLLQWTSTADTAAFQLANGSGCQSTWSVAGNVSLLGKVAVTNSTAGLLADTLVLNGTGVQTFVNGLKNKTLTNIKIAVRPGSTISLDATNTLGTASSTSFTLPAGATMITGNAAGLNGSIPSQITAVSLSTGANYTYNGLVAQVTGALLPATVNNLTMNNPVSVTTSAPVTVSGLLTLQAGYLIHTPNTVTANCANIVTSGGTAYPLFYCNQTTGDFQSAASGNWNSIGTWNTWNGSAWVAASSTPSTGVAVRIIPGHTVTVTSSVAVDSVIIDTLGALAVNSGTTFLVNPRDVALGKGRLSASGGSTVTINGTYQHNVNNGSLPIATWGIGSTCYVTGTTANAPGNGSQNFYNFTWECRDQNTSASSGLNVGWNNNTIGGNVSVLNTGCKGATMPWFRLTNNTFGQTTPNVITINGNVIVNGDSTAFTVSGSGAPNHFVRVIVKGNLTQTAWTSTADTASFQLANGSGCQGNWYVAGNVSLAGKAVGTHSNAALADSLYFNGTGVQAFSNSLKNRNLTNWKIAVVPNSTLSMDGASTMGVATGTTFNLPAGATFLCGHANGIKGNIPIPTAPVLDVAANYGFNGTVAQGVSTIMPTTVNNLTINNTAGVTVDSVAGITVNGILALENGVLTHTGHLVTLTNCSNLVKTNGSAVPKICESTDVTITIHMVQGWNLVSVPVIVPDFTASVVFPGIFGDAFKFVGGGYVTAPILEFGLGYWTYFTAAKDIDVTGSIAPPTVIHCAAGWNLIGSREVPITVPGGIITVPAGAIFGDVFGYSGGGYAPIITIQPGAGAWIYCTSACDITI